MELKPLILALLEEGPYYGYQLVERAHQKGSLEWKEGAIYPLLHKMEGEGLLKFEWRKAPTGKDRKYYSLSTQGKKSLAQARAEWKRQVQVVSGILMGGGRHGQPAGSAS